MSFSIEGFKGALKQGGARPNLFEVNIFAPYSGMNDLRFFAKAASIPSSVVGQIDVPYFGRQVKVSGDRTFENWNITVINDEEMQIHRAIESWLWDLNSYESNLRVGTSAQLNDYKADATVNHFAKTGGQPIRTYSFKGMFPVNLGAIELAWDSNDQVEEFTVELAYDYYVSDEEDGA